jgi:hypothetical protein
MPENSAKPSIRKPVPASACQDPDADAIPFVPDATRVASNAPPKTFQPALSVSNPLKNGYGVAASAVPVVASAAHMAAAATRILIFMALPPLRPTS